MKKAITLLCLCGLLLSLVSCGQNDCPHEYESEVVYNASYSGEGKIEKTCIYCGDEIEETIPKLAMPIEVTVTAMDTVEQKNDPLVFPDGTEIFQPSTYWIVFELDVKNLSDKDITSFSGKIVITDNDRTLNVSGTFKHTIKVGETAHLSDYGFQVDHSDLTMADNMLLGKDIKDIQIEFQLQEVKN